MVGNGKQYVLDVTAAGVVPIAAFDTQEGVYDCAWGECNENLIVSALGDGSAKLWDLKSPFNPITRAAGSGAVARSGGRWPRHSGWHGAASRGGWCRGGGKRLSAPEG